MLRPPLWTSCICLCAVGLRICLICEAGNTSFPIWLELLASPPAPVLTVSFDEVAETLSGVDLPLVDTFVLSTLFDSSILTSLLGSHVESHVDVGLHPSLLKDSPLLLLTGSKFSTGHWSSVNSIKYKLYYRSKNLHDLQRKYTLLIKVAVVDNELFWTPKFILYLINIRLLQLQQSNCR